MLNPKKKILEWNTMKKTQYSDFTIFFFRQQNSPLNSAVDYTNSNFYICKFCLHFHYISPLYYLMSWYNFQAHSHFNLLLHTAYLSELVGKRKFWRLYCSTLINGKWNALETWSACFNSLQKVIDTKMHLM